MPNGYRKKESWAGAGQFPGYAGHLQARALEGLAVGVIELVAVAMALRDDLLAIKTSCQ